MFQNSSRRPTLQDVAKAAGVSKQTVSRVVNNSESVLPDTRARVLAVIEQLGYRPNHAARMLTTRRSNILEVLTIDTETSLFRSTLTQMTRTAEKQGYNISFSTFKSGYLRNSLADLAARQVDGAILIASLFNDDLEDVTYASQYQAFPIVQITSRIGLNVPAVGYDQATGMQQLAEYLIGLGHTRFAEIGGREDMIETVIRHEAWVTTAQKHGIDPGPQVYGRFSVQSGYDGARTLLERGTEFTALICANDRMALGALHALQERGIRIPDDISVAGYDNIEDSEHFYPPLTTVAMDFNRLGQLAIDCLIERISKPDTLAYQRVLLPQLVIRESTASPKA